MGVDLEEMVVFLDDWLDIDGVEDASLNGLQIEGVPDVDEIAVAVDAAAPTIDAAVERGCQALVVHHGLFWGGARPLTGPLGDRVRRCFAGGLSVYAAHLPLDLHPEVGNNVLLARRLGAQPVGAFGDHGGVEIGAIARLPEERPLAAVAGALAAAGCDDQTMWAFGPDPVERIAVVTGAGCSLLEDAVAAGADLLVTGEPRHSAYHDARAARINCIFAGHYATETFGVRAVGERLERQFGVGVTWIDHPTGV